MPQEKKTSGKQAQSRGRRPSANDASAQLTRLFKKLRQELETKEISVNSAAISQLMNQIHKTPGNELMKLVEKDKDLILLINALIGDTVVVMNDLWVLWGDLLLSLISIEWILMEMKGIELPLPKLPEPWPPRPRSRSNR